MAWNSNISSVVASLNRKQKSLDSKMEDVANQGRQIGVQSIQAFCPVDTSNLSNSYESCSTVEKLGEAHYMITFTSDVEYQKYVELGTSKMAARPHLAPGVHAAIPQINAKLKEVI